MADDGANPAVQGRRLRTELRKARVAVGKTQEQVAVALDWSPSKVIRIENGSVRVSTTDLKAMLDQYQVVEESRIAELVALARGSRARAWWDQYGQVVSKDLLELIANESAASSTLNFQPLLIPGLLQTEEYARTSIRMLDSNLTDEEVNARVEIRMRRKELLDRADNPRLQFILGEAVVRIAVGGKDVMARQIHSLIEAAERHNATIQVVPFSAGVRFGMLTPFVVFGFPDAADQDVLYLESPRGDLIIRDKFAEIQLYRRAFEQLRMISLGASDSLTFLQKVADEPT
jgi:transcriptional regulator with XRE-family HTH domain